MVKKVLFYGTCYVRLWVEINGIQNVIMEEFKERLETNDVMFVKERLNIKPSRIILKSVIKRIEIVLNRWRN